MRPREESADAEASGTGAARIEPGGFAQLWLVNWLIWRLLSRLPGTSGSQLFGTIGLAGGLFRTWLYFGARLMPGRKSKRYQPELVILRVAWLRNCRYVFDHHLRMGRHHGITHDVIDRIAQGSTAPGWTHSEVALLSAAARRHRISSRSPTEGKSS